MNLHLGSFEDRFESSKNSDWKLVTKPDIKRWQLLAFPVAIINMGVLALMWVLFTPAKSQLNSILLPIPIFGFLFCLVGVDLTPTLIPVPTGVLLLSLRTPVVSGP